MVEILKYLKTVGLPLVILLVFFLIDPFAKGYLAAYLLTALIYVKKDFIQKNFDFDFVILFIFSITYALFSLLNPDIYKQTIIFYGVFPPVFFLLGKYFVVKSKKTEHLFILLISVGFLFSFSALISVVLNLTTGGFAQYERSIPMFWNGNEITATLMGAFFTFNMCLPAILLTGNKKHSLLFRIASIIVFILSLLCTFRLGSRTQIAIFILTILISFVFIIPRLSGNKSIKLIFILFTIAILVYMYIPSDLNSEYLSTLGKRLQESDNTGNAGGRTNRWAKSIINLFKKPLGWSVNEFGYSHNLWLDVARINGFIPFILLLIFSLRTFLKTKTAISIDKNQLPFNNLILIFTIAANLLFFVEPITEGLFSMFLVYCFLHGVINKYVSINAKAPRTI
ncbi:MAG: hypothetical protein V3U92_00470 [Cellulophaga sp.]